MDDHLYILWTNGNVETAEKMVFMYGVNSLLQGWWEKVTIIIWGEPAKLVSENEGIRKNMERALDAGVHLTACRACADQLGTREQLEDMGVEVMYWGEPLTRLLKNDAKLLTV